MAGQEEIDGRARERLMAGAPTPGEPRRISSRENPLFRELVHVAGSARERRRREASLIEGVHLCDAYLRRHGQPLRTIVSEDSLGHPEVGVILDALGEPPVVLAAALFRSLSAVEHGVGVAMMIETPRPALPATIDTDAVYLDRLQDPGNVGTILRTCAAAGVTRVITAPQTAWCWSPKVLRAAMGAHFHLDVHEAVPWETVAGRLRIEVRATSASASAGLWAADLRAPGLWLFGREGSGLSPELVRVSALTVSIPQSAAVESLNVGVAAALCLYEQLRQRRAEVD